METVNINIRTDKATKQRCEYIFSELGLNMTTAINMFLRAVLREGGIPLDLHADIPNAETRAAMKEIDDMIAHPEKYKSYSSAEEMMEDIFADEV